MENRSIILAEIHEHSSHACPRKRTMINQRLLINWGALNTQKCTKKVPIPAFKNLCDIVIYKRYILSHSDNLNIFLIYIWSLYTIFAYSSWNSWNFLCVEDETSVFYYLK